MKPPKEELVFTRFELEQRLEENEQLKRHVQDNVVWFDMMRQVFVRLGMPQEANGCRLLGQRGQELLSMLKERQAEG